MTISYFVQNNAINSIAVTPQALNMNNPVQAKRSSGWKYLSSFSQLRQELNSYGVRGVMRGIVFTPSCAFGLHGAIYIQVHPDLLTASETFVKFKSLDNFGKKTII